MKANICEIKLRGSIMRKIFMVLLSAVFLSITTSSFGANFVPQTLKIKAPSVITYNFDGKNLSIPLTVTGTPANVSFFLYTKGKAGSIVNVTNGYLGWHYVNKVDTCVSISTGLSMEVGANVINWNGRGKDKTNLVPAGDYTYYIFAYDDKSPRILATTAFSLNPWGIIHIQENDTDGKPLAQPFITPGGGGTSGKDATYYNKWILGNNPQDKTLVESTTTPLPTGWKHQNQIAFLPDNHHFYFSALANTASSLQGIAKWQWVPGGASVLQTSWGENGFSTYSCSVDIEPGVVTDGVYLYTGNDNYHSNTPAAMFYTYDFDGGLVKKIDLTSWWSNPNDLKAGGFMNGGPSVYYERNGYIFLNCHCSCVKQMINPMAENNADFYLWTNRNGDYVLDKNFDAKSSKTWVCNDFNTGPYTYDIAADNNLFSFCPTYDIGAVSFGLMGPDGSGIGYFSYSGETAQQKYGNFICQNGSIYDGIYTGLNSATGLISGVYYVGQTSVKGTISNNVEVKETVPSPFSVAQNIPNPFNPSTTINFALARPGKVTVDIFNAAGQKVDTVVNANMSAGDHSAIWNASKYSAGVYFYTVTSGSFTKTMKMTLLK
jgi:hypothetical protein